MNKKAREKWLLQEFVRCSGIFSGYTIVERERPDFQLNPTVDGAKPIAIEVTEYLSGQPTKRGAANRRAEEICAGLRARVTKAFREGPHRTSLERRYGLLCFKPDQHGVPLKSPEEKAFIAELESFALQNDKPGQHESRDLHASPTLQKRIHRLWLRDGPDAWVESNWDCTKCLCGWVGVTAGELKGILRNKEKLAGIYRTKGNFDRVILLVAAAGGRISECAGLPYPLQESREQWRPAVAALGFDEVYFYARDMDWAMKLWPGEPALYGHRNRTEPNGVIFAASSLSPSPSLYDHPIFPAFPVFNP